MSATATMQSSTICHMVRSSVIKLVHPPGKSDKEGGAPKHSAGLKELLKDRWILGWGYCRINSCNGIHWALYLSMQPVQCLYGIAEQRASVTEVNSHSRGFYHLNQWPHDPDQVSSSWRTSAAVLSGEGMQPPNPKKTNQSIKSQLHLMRTEE